MASLNSSQRNRGCSYLLWNGDGQARGNSQARSIASVGNIIAWLKEWSIGKIIDNLLNEEGSFVLFQTLALDETTGIIHLFAFHACFDCAEWMDSGQEWESHFNVVLSTLLILLAWSRPN